MRDEYVMTREAWRRMMLLDLQYDRLGAMELNEFRILQNMYKHDVELAKQRIRENSYEAKYLMGELAAMAELINHNL